MFCDDTYECILYARLVKNLDNKDSILYITLLLAIRKLENGKKQYIISKRISRKIFISVGIRKYQLMIRYKLTKKNPLSLIPNCYNDTWQWLFNIYFFILFNSDNISYF